LQELYLLMHNNKKKRGSKK